jgi:CheY-like chemotaxis protein
VDDDAYLLSITKTILERLGYIVTSAYNSSEAIELIKEYHDVYDVMITDYLMPGMNGIELAAEVNKLLENTPIILYTGTVELIDEKEIAETEIAEIVNKLCKIQDLDNIIRRVINGNLETSPL